jgi:hypothetical protein
MARGALDNRARRAAILVAGSRQEEITSCRSGMGVLLLPVLVGTGVAQALAVVGGRVVRWQLCDGLGLDCRLGAGIMWL